MIREVDTTAFIILYKPEKSENDIIETNDSGIGVMAKNVILNYSESIPKYLWQIQQYFPNGYPNGKRLFSKFRILYNILIKNIIMMIKEALKNYIFFAKIQLLQHWDLGCIRWLYQYMDRADCQSLNNYFSSILKVKLKRKIPLACIVKNIFIGKTQDENKNYIVKRK